MSDEKDESRKAELVKSEAGKVTRIEPAPTGIVPRLSRFLFRARRDKELLDAHAAVIRSQAGVGRAYEELERTTGRLVDLDNILATDKAGRDKERLEAERDRLLLRKEVEDIARAQRREARLSGQEDDVRQAEMELELEERLAAIRARRKRLEETTREDVKKEPVSVADQLRAAVAKDTEIDAARAQVLAEERRYCQEKVEKGEMTEDEMAHHLAVVEASLNRHVPRRR